MPAAAGGGLNDLFGGGPTTMTNNAATTDMFGGGVDDGFGDMQGAAFPAYMAYSDNVIDVGFDLRREPG